MTLKKFSLIYNLYNTIATLIAYINSRNTIKKVFYSDEFKFILSSYLNTNFRNDWIGRIYGVINPNININGTIDFSNTIIELNDELTNDDLFVQNWIYRQLNLMKNALKIKNTAFFDYIGMNIEKIEPQNQNNYLIIFDIVDRVEFVRSLKQLVKIISIYIMLFFSIYILINFVF
jgi:hypothetical protein